MAPEVLLAPQSAHRQPFIEAFDYTLLGYWLKSHKSFESIRLTTDLLTFQKNKKLKKKAKKKQKKAKTKNNKD